MNIGIYTGRMTRDPIMRHSKKSGRIFCSMRFCIQGDYRGKEHERETDFIDVLAFGTKAQVMNQHIRKGMRLLLLAGLKSYERIDPYGQKRTEWYLVVKSYEMIDSRELREPIEDLSDSSGTLLIPKEITDSLIKQIDTKDEDVPEEFADVERSIDDLL